MERRMHLAGVLPPDSAQQIDGPTLGDGPQPGAERTAGIVSLAGTMDSQQHVLHDILDIASGNAPRAATALIRGTQSRSSAS